MRTTHLEYCTWACFHCGNNQTFHEINFWRKPTSIRSWAPYVRTSHWRLVSSCDCICFSRFFLQARLGQIVGKSCHPLLGLQPSVDPFSQVLVMFRLQKGHKQLICALCRSLHRRRRRSKTFTYRRPCHSFKTLNHNRRMFNVHNTFRGLGEKTSPQKSKKSDSISYFGAAFCTDAGRKRTSLLTCNSKFALQVSQATFLNARLGI